MNISVTRAELKAKAPVWFSKSAMQFFQSVLHTGGYRVGDSIYFVTSEKCLDEPRRWTVRVMDWTTGDITNIGEFQQYATLEEALTAMKNTIKEARKL